MPTPFATHTVRAEELVKGQRLEARRAPQDWHPARILSANRNINNLMASLVSCASRFSAAAMTRHPWREHR
jgi:hypothetical protein